MSQFIVDSLRYTSNVPTTSRLLSATSRPLSNAVTPWTVNLRSNNPNDCVTIKDLRFYRDFAPTFQFATKIFIKHDEHPQEEDENDEADDHEIGEDAAVGDGSTSQNKSSLIAAEDEISDIVNIIRPMTRFLKKFGWRFSHRSSDDGPGLPPRIIDELILQMPNLEVADIFSSSSLFDAKEIESFASILTKSSSLGLKFHVAILSDFCPLRSLSLRSLVRVSEQVQSIFKKYDIVEILQERAIKFCRDEDPSCLPYFLNIMLTGINLRDDQEAANASEGDRKNKKNTLVEKLAPMIDFLEFILNCQDYFKALPTNRAIWLLCYLVDFIEAITCTSFTSTLQVFVDKFNLCALLERVFDISEMILDSSSSWFLDENDNKNSRNSDLYDLAVTVVKCFALAIGINHKTMWHRISQSHSGSILSFARDGGRSFEFFPMERLQKFLLGLRKVFTLAALKKKTINPATDDEDDDGEDHSTSNEQSNHLKPVEVCCLLSELLDKIAKGCFSEFPLEEEINHGHTPSFIKLQIVPIFCQIILESDFFIDCDTMEAQEVCSCLGRATAKTDRDNFGNLRQRSPLCVRVAVARAFAGSIDVLNSLLQCADKVLKERLEEIKIVESDPYKQFKFQERSENLFDDFVRFMANLGDSIDELSMTDERSILDGVSCFDEELLSSVRSRNRELTDACRSGGSTFRIVLFVSSM